MKIAILGTGTVGRTLGDRLAELGHDVSMGSRDAAHAGAAAWADAGERRRHGSFADAARFGELLVNCTSGSGSLAALERAGSENMQGKVLIDVSNPLELEKGKAPRVVLGPESLGERIQRAFPHTRVVKALNTVNCKVMADPMRVGGAEHDALFCGDDDGAKREVESLLRSFGWRSFVDLGRIETARALEAYVELWIRLRLHLDTSDFNVRVVR